MRGLGTIINVAAIIAGGLIGIFFKRYIKEHYQETIIKVTGISVIFLGAAGSLSKMLAVNPATGALETQKSLMMILSLVLGALIGEIINIEGAFERLGEWLKMKSGSSGDTRFLDAFLTASFTVCIGAMAIIGAIQDGITGDRVDRGRTLRGPLDPGREGDPGPRHHRDHGGGDGEGVHFLGGAGRDPAGERDAAFGVPCAGDDGGGGGQPLAGREYTDFLRGAESDSA